ncbi:hypothetical protein F444_15271, partial [Phytophthora nicotianae P1976]
VLRTRSTKSVAERNKQIDNAKKSSSEIIPPDWETYAKTIICTHGFKHRYRGKGKRPRQGSTAYGMHGIDMYLARR